MTENQSTIWTLSEFTEERFQTFAGFNFSNVRICFVLSYWTLNIFDFRFVRQKFESFWTLEILISLLKNKTQINKLIISCNRKTVCILVLCLFNMRQKISKYNTIKLWHQITHLMCIHCDLSATEEQSRLKLTDAVLISVSPLRCSYRAGGTTLSETFGAQSYFLKSRNTVKYWWYVLFFPDFCAS